MGEEESEWENTMLDQTTFTETVREVSEIIRTSSDPLTKEQILAYFSDMELNEEQQELVINYLLTPQKEPVQQELEEQKTEETEESGTEGGLASGAQQICHAVGYGKHGRDYRVPQDWR